VTGVWIAALYVTFSFAVSKSVPFTYAAIPAVGFAVWRLAERGLAARSFVLRVATLGLFVATAAATLLFSAALAPYQAHYQWLKLESFAGPISQSLLYRLAPYLYVLGATLVATGLCALGLWYARRCGPRSWVVERRVMGAVLGVSVLALGFYWLNFDIPAIAQGPLPQGPWPLLGQAVMRETPANATLITLKSQDLGGYTLDVMFWAHRDIYPEPSLDPTTVCALSRQAAAAGSPLYVLTTGTFPGRLMTTFSAGHARLYRPICPVGA
ncbi:MAG: hypothetical protein IVW57_19590, partial [Ktedonobacterales bacterium]|nr:hypothetical protein [Ktedonobacterales bacterium]